MTVPWVCAVADVGVDIGAENETSQSTVIHFSAEFFAQYQPDTAFEMVAQLPAFNLDDGGSVRGFGGAAGNVLINNRRPSAKQDPPSAILQRIPASTVQRIELMRGQVAGIDTQGHSVLVNVVLYEDAPAAIRWNASLREHSNVTPLRPEASISLAHSFKGIDYTAGLSAFRATFGDEGTEDVFDGSAALLETRLDEALVYNVTSKAFLNASAWVGDVLINSNSLISYIDRDEELLSLRTSEGDAGEERSVIFGDKLVTRAFEFGFDAERRFGANIDGKAILLLAGSEQERRNDQRTIEFDGQQSLYRVADSDRETSERILRFEFDWTGWDSHDVQADFEITQNVLDNMLLRTDDTGSGPVEVVVPGANTRVEEIRGDLLLQDTWVKDDWSINYGIGAESSTISQVGDADQKRSFFFIKPQLQLTRTHNQAMQTRLQLFRDVAQLNFDDFVSAALFLDDDLALGNPNLKPETAWIAEIKHEQRWGDLSVVTLGGFYHWISDVQDLLPITAEFEVPGNIGDGERWGLELQGTVAMDWMGLPGSRLDLATRWQNSSVTDPVTGVTRVLSASGGFSGVPTSLPFNIGNEWAFSLSFRQDLEASRIAWGWGLAKRAERPRFKVNELDTFSEGQPIVDVFIETTRWLGIKLGFEINNLLDLDASRDRRLYSGLRDLSPVERRELQNYSLGRRLILYASGSW